MKGYKDLLNFIPPKKSHNFTQKNLRKDQFIVHCPSIQSLLYLSFIPWPGGYTHIRHNLGLPLATRQVQPPGVRGL